MNRVRSSYACPDCTQKCSSSSGLTRHHNASHRPLTATPDGNGGEEIFSYRRHHLLTANPCDENGQFLPAHTRPPLPPQANTSWDPFPSQVAFDFASFHFVEQQTSESGVNKALDLWQSSLLEYGENIPWANAQDLYATIDSIQHGHAPWKTFKLSYSGPLPEGTPPRWMTDTFELCTRNSRTLLHQQLETAAFKDKIHYVPYMQFRGDGSRVWSNLMSADWATKQADLIATDPLTHGAMFVPIVAGSDKTTVSVATGHQEYHPVYMSPGNLSNVARRAHGNALLPVAFLPIPKSDKRQRKRPQYQKFCRQLYHACLAQVFRPLKPGMTTPEIVKCPDGQFRRAIYGLGPYIADYPEQVWLTGIVQDWCPKCLARPDFLDDLSARLRTHEKTDLLINSFNPVVLWDDYGIRSDVMPFTHEFPRADIHELICPDLLHQVIKGTFKDHLVLWVGQYQIEEHGETRGLEIIQDIDRRISAVPSFPGLRRFPDGRDFVQWTGDDSKSLMKVYLAAIVGHVPSDMVKCVSAFLDFCYISRRNAISAEGLDSLQDALTRFHQHRDVFIHTGVRTDISLPRQHSLVHYIRSIRLFGSPNGLCSSITESKYIKAVKEPWRRSSRYRALVQMLRTLSRLDKMAAACRIFTGKGMMEGSTASYTGMVLRGEQPQPLGDPTEDGDDDDEDHDLGPVSGPRVLSSIELAKTSERNYPHDVDGLARILNQPQFPDVLRRFLWDQVTSNPSRSPDDVPLDECPQFEGHIKVYHSAVARFYAPSDLCGTGGMYRERIRSTPNWRREYPRHDTVFVETDAELSGMRGMLVARVLLFFSFFFRDQHYPCALVHWFIPVGDEPDHDTGMWVVRPEFKNNRRRSLSVIQLDGIVRGAHLIPVYGSSLLPEDFHFSDSLHAFRAYFVSRHADHHMYEFLGTS
ncbi:hypothetical protein EDB85DRAFT_1867717 [Lactarius pseudohatsudake]|nr:hypothetical protein EDB85DRAFT_1867717 [Lactarius pseudohatsudake]